eukprot:gb/GECH01000833.1/.p1 GENE.gb/GECH01000833.1/~~gb/GECH01000833.1/.p1  ORF type:complete len:952 (+),score=153.80 gb/GECH01000833.1/:1-2856(+)
MLRSGFQSNLLLSSSRSSHKINNSQFGSFLSFRSYPSIYYQRQKRFYTSNPQQHKAPKKDDLLQIERRWKEYWRHNNADTSTPTSMTSSSSSAQHKFYSLAMFPYPSGSLHMGHVRVYTISDTLARGHRMRGAHVLHPMGWDAFGLPAENAAIERHSHPSQWTSRNVAEMRDQLDMLSFTFDWDRQVTTCHPSYYKWTQWLFIQMMRAGKAYQKEAVVNWDPIDRTVLANEQVDALGKSWRSGAAVERRKLNQWFLKLTDYADHLLEGLGHLEEWPDTVKHMQEAWIGKSVGSQIKFGLSSKNGVDLQLSDIEAFTTRADTIYGVTFIAVAAEHPLVDQVLAQHHSQDHEALDRFVHHCRHRVRRVEDDSKDGMYLGVDAEHPLTGNLLPVYVTDYVLLEYGSGCVMGVPAHDDRDFEFAHQHNIPIHQVVFERGTEQSSEDSSLTQAFSKTPESMQSDNLVVSNSSPSIDGLSPRHAAHQIAKTLQQEGKGRIHTEYRLRDWLISRQRYWGAPIPVIHCPECGAVPVPEKDLPVTLPENVELTGRGGSPLSNCEEWVNVPCPCGKGTPSRRETDTMDTFMDSSWYFLRYTDPKNDSQIFDPKEANHWMNVDSYIGGIEHAVLHLLYARFVQRFLHDQGYVEDVEPIQRLVTQGMVLGPAFKEKTSGRFLLPTQVEKRQGQYYSKETGEIVNVSMEKMSKSKYNGVDPREVVEEYGADVTRLYMLFKAPPEKDLEWDNTQILGQSRWLLRLQSLMTEFGELKKETDIMYRTKELGTQEEKSTRMTMHLTIKNVTQALFEYNHFNVAVSELHKLSNALQKCSKLLKAHSIVYQEAMQTLAKLLAPMAPHFASEMWFEVTKHLYNEQSLLKKDVHLQSWPVYEEQYLQQDTKIVVVQIKGKKIDAVEAPINEVETAEGIENFARQLPKVKKALEGRTVKKVIAVKGLINFVVV